ncbi:MAG: restriction endonuclease subunit S [Burkholderiales bacterium]|nr:restriction endonuclease subunit S [Burkholderiales bacterium]
MAKDDKSTVTPRLRFPEFRNAEGWETAPLEDIAERVSTKNSDGGVTRVLTNSAERGVLDQRDYFDRDIATAGKVDGYYIVDQGDYVYNPRTSAIAPVGPISRNNIGKGLMSPLYTVFRFSTDKTDFYEHYFRSTGWHSYLRSAASTGARHDRMSITTGAFMRMPVPTPDPSEQQKIADCLTSLDEVIAAQGQKVDALKAHKRGLMQQLFPRDGETLPRFRFPEFRDAPEWETHALSKFITALDAGVSVNSGDRPASDTEIGILKTSCVTSGVFDPSENKVVLESEELERVKEPVRSNTIIISRMNTPALVGANAYVQADLANIFLPDRLWAAKSNSNGYLRFISYILGSEKGRTSLSELATGTSGSMKNISKSAVLELQISAPDLPEQQKIADCLTCLDTQIAAESEKLEALKSHKKGLMHQLFP